MKTQITVDGKKFDIDVTEAIRLGIAKKHIPKKNAIVKFYRYSDEDGYTYPCDSYEEQERNINEMGYGEVIVDINGRSFKIKPFKE